MSTGLVRSYGTSPILPEAAAAARAPFAQLNDQLELSNAKMLVANDRLGNELAKLEGGAA